MKNQKTDTIKGIFMKTKITLYVVLLLLLPAITFARLNITVQPNRGWGDIETEEIKSLCYNVVSHFQDELRDEHKVRGVVNVYYDASGPFVNWDGNKHNVALSPRDGYLPQIVYQFSHEFCHIIHDYPITTENNPTLWFQESICMLSSIWVLLEMSETWEDNAPYPKWADDRHALFAYANVNENRPEVQYAGTAAEWLEEWEDFLRADYYKNSFTHHLLVSQLSYKFLPIFQENPETWNAVRKMPSSTGKISNYMQDWYNKVDIEDKEYVKAIAEEMGIEVMPTLPSVVNADYTNLTFSYNSDNSIIPVNNSREWNGYPPIGTWEKTPDGNTLSRGGNDPFDEMDELSHWIYSHAPATIIYDISEINPASFGAYFLLPHPYCGGAASMDFTAKADGVELYSEDFYLADYGASIAFEIPKNTQRLTLEIGDLGNQGCDHFVLGEPRLYHNDSVVVQEEIEIDADVNKDGYVDIHDVMIVRSGMQKSVSYDTDINNDGVTDEIDLLIVKAKAFEAIAAAAPKKINIKLTTWGSMKRRY